MVTNYLPNKCKYSIGKLDDVVYLISRSDLGVISIDNGEAYMSSASSVNCLALEAHNLNLTESESLDERYEFLHTLQFSVNGYKNKGSLLSKYYVIVKDLSNTYWILNPNFPCKVTYTYTLASNINRTDFTMATKSNFPMLRLANFNPNSIQYKWVDMTSSTSYICDDCDSPSGSTEFITVDDMQSGAPYKSRVCHTYEHCGVNRLWINLSSATKLTQDAVSYTNEGFKEVIYNKDSCTFSEIYDGNTVNHQLSFKINMDAYQSSWHYNLLEFMQNQYAVVMSTTCGFNIAVCNSYGLQPSYTIEASNTDTNNVITVTMSDVHDQGELIIFPKDLIFEHTSATTWIFVDGEYECVSTIKAKHLLMEEYDIFGNPLDLYKCLDGYSEDYEYLSDKLVGVFDDTPRIYFDCTECAASQCKVQTSIIDGMTFTKSGESKTYQIYCDSDFTLESSSSAITLSPTSGEANIVYQVVVENASEPDADNTYTLTLTYCDGLTKTYNVNVKKPSTVANFPNGINYYVPCSGGTLLIPTPVCVSSFEADNPKVITNKQIQAGYIKMVVNPYDCSMITLTVTLCDGTVENLYIEPPSVLGHLKFIAEEDGTFRFTNPIQYSIDSGYTWTTLSSDTNSPTISAGNSIMWKATLTPSSDGIGTFSSSNKFNVQGNIMSLLYGNNFGDKTSLSDKSNVFKSLFSGCTRMTSAENLSLPATTLSEGCYQNMFNGCTSLTTAPTLVAQNLEASCYAYLFYGCSSLNEIKVLASSFEAQDCTNNWVYGVSSTGTFTKIRYAILIRGASGIPNNWDIINIFAPITNN